ncbi:PREDICTED: piggyBac transposable element-derived protein 1-like [Habropoda laboriosa]|uniref:piggyBac transposable element-derived protein 1-like n=1 Tax=Habropoda laboriosa TaxID=597456 RepID=UPI00083CE340|nr:PREDICTED: piggyBac transposable element-derived protein 1-like [Habropoda laboriosa]
MERNTEISSSEDEFDFTVLNEEITSLHRELVDTENNSSSDDKDSQSDSTEWISCTESEEIPSRIPFIAGDTTAGPHAPPDKKEPLDFLKLFVTNKLANGIVIETNNYATKKLEGKTLSPYSIWRNWRNVTIEEMWAFIGVIINMGTMPLANLQEYWSRNDVSYIPFYSNKFTRDRFNQIFWMLHLKTIQRQDAGPRTRLQLFGCFLDYINSKFFKYFTPRREICVDESTVKFKDRISFITYNPKKPTKWGIRVYTMADTSGINENTIASLYNAAGKNAWCSRISYVH